MTAQLDAFVAPPPPTGPPADLPPRDSGRHAAYRAWVVGSEGRKIWQHVAQHALAAWERHERRISTKGLVEAARAELHVQINNTYTAWLADDLVAQYPVLVDVIERRKRHKAA